MLIEPRTIMLIEPRTLVPASISSPPDPNVGAAAHADLLWALCARRLALRSLHQSVAEQVRPARVARLSARVPLGRRRGEEAFPSDRPMAGLATPKTPSLAYGIAIADCVHRE